MWYTVYYIIQTTTMYNHGNYLRGFFYNYGDFLFKNRVPTEGIVKIKCIGT